MLKPIFNIPNNVQFILACSGGVDSMAVADFYKKSGKDFVLAYFNHGTQQSTMMANYVYFFAESNKIPFVQGRVGSNERSRNLSQEDHYRNERYEWLKKIANGRPIVTCHHLDDACEKFLISAIHGAPKVIQSSIQYSVERDAKILRPFLTNTKQDLVDWCINNNVSWIENEVNKNISNIRNKIKLGMMSQVREINPGIHRTIKKKIITEYSENPVLFRNFKSRGEYHVSSNEQITQNVG